MELIQRTIQHIKERRNNVLKGNVNCIPSPFKSFRSDFLGTEQECYYIITGQQKSAKTKFTSYVFLYNNILYAYYNPTKVRIKVLYVPLEETQEKITLRFMCFLLFHLSGHKIHITVKELESVNENMPIDEEIIKILESEEYMNILEFYEKSIIWVTETNPTGIYKQTVRYAVSHGIRYDKAGNNMDAKSESNAFGNIEDRFDHYVANDPQEYVEIIIDHISLISTESQMDLRQSIKKLSLYLNEVKNKYKYIPIVIAQQSTETQDREAFKLNKIRPTAAGISDCKDIKNECNIMIGLTNPYYHEIKNYLGYDITKLKDSQRFVEIILSRDGSANAVKALYFDGAVSFFSELPAPNNPEYESFMERVYALIDKLKQVKRQAVSLLNFGKKQKSYNKLNKDM